jgi:hypothetical protein
MTSIRSGLRALTAGSALLLAATAPGLAAGFDGASADDQNLGHNL